MRNNAVLVPVGLLIVGIGVSLTSYFESSAESSAVVEVDYDDKGWSQEEIVLESVPFATPPGITLQPLGKAQGYGLDKESATYLPRDEIAYTDPRGMTMYTYKKDPPGESICVDRCAQIWPPVIAAADAEAVGNWSIIERDDNSRQWALNGRPLYTYVEDVHVGSVAGNSPKILSRGEFVSTRGSFRGVRPERKELPADWEPALLYPSNVELPKGMGIVAREVADAKGLTLVNSVTNKTLYTFKGDPNRDGLYCGSPCEWIPLSAPGMATVEVGDFGFLNRDDGIRQWTWNGMGLYTNANDFGRGDANGVGVHERWQPAHILRYPIPENVKYFQHPRLGKVLSTIEGDSLYRREGFIFKSGSGHNLHRGVPHRPAVGRDLGVDPRCVNDCDKWKPFLAPESAQASGYWDVYERPDGSKQWAYQGFALWTYSDDQNPGEIRGHDKWDLIDVTNPDPKAPIDIGTPYDGAPALYWHAATP
jgi:predicted lipoprotein with Yx(FWY)xxD motif